MSKKASNIVFVFTSCKKSGPIQQMLYLIKNLDRNLFNPYLITIYNESQDLSRLNDYLPYVKHYKVLLTKKEILLGKTGKLKNKIKELQPKIIHSLGIFPDYAVCRMGFDCQVITIRNFVFDDYPSKFGKLVGNIVARIHLYTIKQSEKTYTCSKSLASEYKKKLNLDFDYIQNGVSIDLFHKATLDEKILLRTKLNIPLDKILLIYTGQFVDRKNQRFLLESFRYYDDCCVYLLGDGKEKDSLKSEYESDNIIFTGNVENVNEYLQASDIYISTSKSEGLPNGVLEAMSSGLPVLLSDIPQHKELFFVGLDIGRMYISNDKEDFELQLKELLESNLLEKGNNAYREIIENFTSVIMSNNYQYEYSKIIGKNMSKTEKVAYVKN